MYAPMYAPMYSLDQGDEMYVMTKKSSPADQVRRNRRYRKFLTRVGANPDDRNDHQDALTYPPLRRLR